MDAVKKQKRVNMKGPIYQRDISSKSLGSSMYEVSAVGEWALGVDLHAYGSLPDSAGSLLRVGRLY